MTRPWLALAALAAFCAPASAQIKQPPGTVPASAAMVSEIRGTLGTWSGGFVKARDCRRAIPEFYRADLGWVRTSYTCGR
jgi:hypothetical protein